MYCQLDYLGKCLPGRIRHALDELPETLDGTYERTLREINDANWEFTRRLLLCVAVASRPFRVEELAEFLAFDFKAGPIPKYREDWCLDDPVEAVLSTCSTLLALVNINSCSVVQFSHFSVKEFLMSARFAEKRDIISHRYHVSMTSSHTLVAQVCLGILLHLDKNITRDVLEKFPLAEYAAEHWFKHARFKGVSENADEGMKQLFDGRKPHFSVWLWIYDPTKPSWYQDNRATVPLPPRGTPLHYAAFCGLNNVVKILAVENSQNVNSRSFVDESTPLHLALQEGHVEVARLLVERRADLGARDKDGWTPLHRASEMGHVDLARILVVDGADLESQDKVGSTPLHRASQKNHGELARLLLEHGANVIAQDKDGLTPLHFASRSGHLQLARILLEHGANVVAQDKHGWTPLHFASHGRNVELAWILISHGADATAQDEDGWTPLHLASQMGAADLAQIFVEHSPNVAPRDKHGWTPLHWASRRGHVELAQILVEHDADMAAQDEHGLTPLHLASQSGHLELARMLVEHGADTAAQNEHRSTPLHLASRSGHVGLSSVLIKHGANRAAQDEDGWTPLQWASQRGHVELVRILDEDGHGIDATP